MQRGPVNEMQSAAGLLVVLVVYERDLDQVAAWPQLQQWLSNQSARESIAATHILIYDNSALPRARPIPALSDCSYEHDPENGGTARAYCRAVAMAAARNVDWLLLLDHDTILPDEFLGAARAAIASAAGPPAVQGFVPWVLHGQDVAVSPSVVTRFGSLRAVRPERGIRPAEQITAIASGSVLNTAALAKILPLPAGLWLDYVDHWIFAQFRRRGYRVAVLEVTIHHDLSISGPTRLTPARLLSMLRGEATYYGLLGSCARLVRPLRIAWRLMQMTVTNPRLARVGWSWLLGSGGSHHDR
jgi:hypothetical protein